MEVKWEGGGIRGKEGKVREKEKEGEEGEMRRERRIISYLAYCQR